MQALGHDGPPTAYWTENLITKKPLAQCPLRSILQAPATARAELERYADSYYPAYRDGYLLVGGGLSDQPARYVELVQLTAAYERRVDKKLKEITAENGDGEE